MKKNSRIIKRVLSLLLIFLLSINSFAAIVSDNDGSAFVTKAEFDALKNDFYKQIDNYNSSIDGKIDGAIASYLAGIDLSDPPINLYDRLKNTLGGDLWMKNKVVNIGENDMDTNFKVNLTRRFCYSWFYNLERVINLHFVPVGTGSGDRTTMRVWTGTELRSKDTTADYSAGNALAIADIQAVHTRGGSNDDTTVTKYLEAEWIEKAYHDCGEYEIGAYCQLKWNWGVNPLYHMESVAKGAATVNEPGSGAAWIYHKQPNGSLVLREYANIIYPVFSIDINSHTYKSFGNQNDANGTGSKTSANILNVYGKDNGKADNTVLSVTIPEMDTWSAIDSGDTPVPDLEKNTTPQNSWTAKISQMKATDPIDYSLLQWGKNSTTSIYCLEDVQQPTVLPQITKPASETTSKFSNVYWTPKYTLLQTNDLSGVEIKYSPVTLTVASKSLNEFSNNYISSVAGETVKIGGGFPILDISDTDQTNTVKIKFKLRDESGNPVTTGNIHYQISNKQFINGSLVSGAKDFTSGVKTIAVGSETSDVITDIKGLLWINFYAEVDGQDASIDTLLVR